MLDRIRILHDAVSMLAVEKPAGLLTQAPNGIDSLELRLRQQLASRTDYLAMVHRLDRDVSGVVLVALSKRIARLLSDQFATQKIQKNYLAVVSGKVDQSPTTWVDYLRKLPNQPQGEVCSERVADAKRAETNVEVLDVAIDHRCSLLRLMPMTGRMHQLRLQSAQRGHPIWGDRLYGGPILNDELVPDGKGDRILLHAESIAFHHPRTGVRTTISCAHNFPLNAFGFA
ncbi:Ribosomal large subunit pseudouridine synthase A [Novipirellula aureliae]|uniref:Ribosomal large subunit pseudouridine synthase A n=1 Tax=Novipirellula aureliae TaxID=2527966 RepID=A0A5C6DLC1_9BACT|nr:RluA family pseudouridine synthase [Novipirellula aureliae]TWU37610.1 Ribosomal large subunit pseudouridine synthase A [Novipirellula aureliae]